MMDSKRITGMIGRILTALLPGLIGVVGTLLLLSHGASARPMIQDPGADLAITKAGSSATVIAGDALTYTLRITNSGALTATGVVVTDTLPTGVHFRSASPDCSNSDRTVTCTLNTLPASDTATLSLVVDVDPATTGSLVNTAVVTATTNDPDTSDNLAEESTDVDAEADLSIAQDHDPGTVVAGHTLTYTLAVTNDGPSDASDVTVTDTLPVSITFGSATTGQGSSCNENSGSITCPIGSLSRGYTATVVITATVAPSVPHGTVLINRAGVAAATNDTHTANNTAVYNTAVDAETDIEVTKTVNNPSPNEGDTIRYTITITNNGPGESTNVVLTDTLPGGVTYATHEASQGIYSSVTGRWEVGSLLTETATTLTIDATVDEGTGGSTITNTTDGLSADQADPTTGNNQGSAAFTVKSADLAVAKTDSPDPVIAGTDLTYTITVTNNGPDDATGVSVSDPLPDGVTYSSSSATQGSYDDGTGVWSVGGLANGESATLTIFLTVNSSTTEPLANSATVSADEHDPNTGNNSATANTTVHTSADLRVTKTVDTSTPNEGELVEYTITVTNDGPSDATSVVLTDTLPSGITYNSFSTTQGSYDDGTGRWSVGDLPDGNAATLTLYAIVNGGTAGSTITNTTDDLSASQADPNAANNQDSAAFTVQSADLTVNKSVDSPKPNEGDTIRYTITITNNGPDTADNIVLTDTLPGGVTYVTHDTSQGTYSNVTGRWEVGSLLTETATTLTIDATVDEGTGGSTITNITAGLSADQADPTPGNNQGSAAFTVKSADLAVTKVGSPDPVIAGTALTYTITVTNNGPDDATGVSVSDPLPDGVTYSSSSATRGSYDDGTGLWSVGELANGESATLTIFLTVNSSTSETLANSSTVSANEHDPNTENNSVTEITNVDVVAGLEIAKTALAATVEAGEQLTYTLTYTNDGPSDATNAVITDTLNINVDYASAQPAPTGSHNGDPYWQLGTLQPGDSGEITLSIRAHRPLTNNFTLTNVAWIDADHTAPLSTTEETNVTSRPVLAMTKLDSTDPITEGYGLDYTIVITNSGNENATGVTVVEQYDDNITVSYADPAADEGSDFQVWTLGTLPVDEPVQIYISAQVNGPLPVDTILTNVVTLDSDQTEPITATEATSVTSVSDLTISKGYIGYPEPVEAGDELVYIIYYNNSGDIQAEGVRITETYDSRVEFVSAYPVPIYGTDNAWYLGDLLEDEGSFIQVRVRVDTPLPNNSVLTNRVTIDSIGTLPKSFTETTVVSSRTDLALSVTDDPDPVEPGDPLAYTLHYTNAGNASATGVVVTATLDSFISLTDATPEANPAGDNVWTWDIEEIRGDGGSGEIVIQTSVTLPLTNSTILNFDAQLVHAEGEPISVTEQTTVSSTAILSLDNSDGVYTVYAGDRLTYTLTYTNSGKENAYDVTITDTLPSYVDYVRCVVQNGTCQRVSAEEVVFHIPVVVAQTSDVAQVIVDVQDPLPAGALYIVNHARMTAPSLAVPIDLQDVDPIRTKPDLRVEVNHTPTLFSPGKRMTYTLDYLNASQHMHTADVIITTILPTSTEYISGGWETSDGHTYTYSAGDLPAGDTNHTIQFVVRHTDTSHIGAQDYDTAFHIAEEDGLVGDAYPEDNTGTAEIGVPDLVVVDFSVEPVDPLPPNTPVTFTIVIKNQGSGPAYNPDNQGGFYIDVFTATVPSYPWTRDSDIYVYAIAFELAPETEKTIVLTHPGFTERQIRDRIGAFYVKVDNYAEPVLDGMGRIIDWTRLWGLVPEYDETNNVGGPIYPGINRIYVPIVLKQAIP